jgi:DNA-binding transcriptional MocR family regulator
MALPISLPQRGSRLLLRDLHRQLRAAITNGRLRAGARLPSTRTLAAAVRPNAAHRPAATGVSGRREGTSAAAPGDREVCLVHARRILCSG